MMSQIVTRALEPLAADAFGIFLDATVKSSLIMVGVAALAVALRSRSAAHRHLVWTVGVAAALAVPVLASVAPPLEVRLPFEVPGRFEAASAIPRAAGEDHPAVLAHAAGVAEGRLAASVPGAEAVRGGGNPTEDAPPSGTGARGTGVRSASAIGSNRGSAGSGAGLGVGDATGSQPGVASGGISPTVLGLSVWMLGALFVLATLLLGLLRLGRIVRDAERITRGPLWTASRRMCLRLRLDRMPIILLGNEAAIPMTWGLRRPVVLLPVGSESWPRWRLEAVLLHELGHVSRRDYLAQLAAHVACALYWFNPLVWVAAHRMRIEREHACDDLVVAAGHDAPGYADDLLRLARSLRSRRLAQAVALGMARPNHLRERLVAILDDTRSRAPLTRGRALAACSLAVIAAFSVASIKPAPAAAGPGPEAILGSADLDSAVGVDAAAAQVSVPQATTSRALVDALAEDARPTAPPHAAPPGLQEASVLCGPADGEARRRASMTDDGRRVIEAEYGDCRSSIRIEGELEFSEDFSALARLSSDARLRIEVERPGMTRRLEARPGPGGRPEYTWSVDGREAAFDAAAERWLGEALIDLFRSSSYMAEERAGWILSRQGPAGIMDEVAVMLSDHAQATYLGILVERADLGPGQVREVIELAGREIESDHSLGEFLMAVARGRTFDAATRAAFLEAAGSLESDHAQGRVFGAALARGDLSPANLRALLQRAASSIESDHTLGELLIELATRYPLEPELRGPFLEAAATLDSDHTAGRVYGVLLEQPGLGSSELAAVLDAATTIESDHTLAELLRGAAGHDLADDALRAAFLRAAATIESDHSRGSVYRAVLEISGIGADDKASILDAASSMHSDHELSSLLIELADRGLPGAALQRAYLGAAAQVESDHSHGEALRAFLGMDSVAEAEQIELLRTARSIESDHSLAELLIEFADRYPVEGRVREAFLETLDTIASRHDHGRVSSAIVRR